MSNLTLDEAQQTLKATLDWSRKRDYSGHSKHDALNSPFLEALSFQQKMLRLFFIQVLMRLPWNIRGFFGVPKLRNPKGIGLFAHALLDRGAWLEKSNNEQDSAQGSIHEAARLLDWLMHHVSPWCSLDEETARVCSKETVRVPKFSENESVEGIGWGYHYPWQDIGFYQPRHYPNRVVTCWIGFAFLRAYEMTGKADYLTVLKGISRFLLNNPKVLYEDENQLCLSYVPTADINWAVMDVSALTAAFCAMLSKHVEQNENLLNAARRLLTFVADKQTSDGAWFYTWPAKDSHIQHDNYHTGIILDCFADYMAATSDWSFEPVYRKGLEYYQQHLFEVDGAPRWMNNAQYPHDIHGAAAGILAFSKATSFYRNRIESCDPEKADEMQRQAGRVLAWTMDNMYNQAGFFYYQKRKYYTKKFCLMRWCNAWMSRALAQSLLVMTSTG